MAVLVGTTSPKRLSLACPSIAGRGSSDVPRAPLPEKPGDSGKPRLLDRVQDAIRVRGYSLRTEEAYVGWIKRYIIFHGKRHPLDMGAGEVEVFLNHLVTGRNVSASTQNQALA